MFSSLINSIPVLGHMKGIIHYAVGDTEGGNTAVYEASRSTAVIGGTAVGLLAGPGGAVAGAMAGGVLTDTCVSLLTREPQGIVAGVVDIGNDIADGNIPVRSIVKTGIMVGSDALCGVGTGVVTKNVAQSVAKSTGKSIGKEIVKGIIVSETETMVLGMIANSQISSKLREDVSCSNRCTSTGTSGSVSSKKSENSEKSNKSDTSNKSIPAKNSQNEISSSDGSQPPRDNKKNKKDHEKQEPETLWDMLLKIFDVESLDDICIGSCYPFKELEEGQKKTLKKLIRTLKKIGGDYYFRQVIKLIAIIFDEVDAKDVTFQNFLSMVNFVGTYISEKLIENNESSCGNTNDSFEVREERLLARIFADLTILATEILHIFRGLCAEISEYSCEPYFRDIFAAVYHYYKHRVLPETGAILSIAEYFNLITSLLQKLKNLKIYNDLGSTRFQIVFERYYDTFNRRVRIVVKVQNNQIELSTCYILTRCFDGDKESDEYVDSEKFEEDKNDEE